MQTLYMHSVKVPRVYKGASRALQLIENHEEMPKSAVFSTKHVDKKALTALLSTALHKSEEISYVLQKSKILESRLANQIPLIKVLISEFLWRKHRLDVDCQPVVAVLQYKDKIEKTRYKLSRKFSRKIDEEGPRTPRGRAKFRLLSFFFTTSCAVFGAFLYNLYRVKVRYSHLLPLNSDLLPLPKSGGYIYICDPLAEAGVWQTQIFPWLPQLYDPSYAVALRLVQETWSTDADIRRNAISMLSTVVLEDSQLYQIAQMIDFDVAVGLAHSNADPRLVAPHRSINLKCPHVSLGARIREILNNLPKDSIHECVIEHSSAALRAFSPTDQELEAISLESVTGFESEQIIGAKVRRKLREDQFLIPCLQAILSHSRVKETTTLLLQNKLMEVLMIVVEKYKCKQEIMYLVVKIIANLTCHPQISSYVKETGCLRFLAELSESEDLKLSMPARRALHNLDREYNNPILPPGIYQLYPDFRYDERQLDMDIVFVHGLLGGAFRTWRREDRKAAFRVTVKPGEARQTRTIREWFNSFVPASKSTSESQDDPITPDIDAKPASRVWENGKWTVIHNLNCVDEQDCTSSGYSQCWPKDWLPKDINNARILAVDFDSFVTHWTNVCPVENIGRTLFDRSSELLEKLSSAGIGSRPIIWVTHSMGGLLVKHLLSQSATSSQENRQAVADQTRGIMFCSVPHIGSNVASRTSAGAALLLMPTQEVKELSYGSEELKKLNETFKRLRQERKYKVISFGETKDVSFSSLGVKLQLVPLTSSDPGFGDFYPLDVDHLNVCKVRSRGAFVYRKLIELVETVRNGSTDDVEDEQLPVPKIFEPSDSKKKREKIVETSKLDENTAPT